MSKLLTLPAVLWKKWLKPVALKITSPLRRLTTHLHHTYVRLAWRHPIMNRLWFQVVSGVLIISFIVSPVSMLLTTYFTNSRYNLSASATALVGKTTVDTKLIKETDTAFTYNRADEASPKVPEQVLIAAGKKTDATGKKPYQAEFGKDPRKGVTFSDSAGDRSLTLTPQFGSLPARMTDDRVMYPNGANEKHVYSLKTNGIKSDIILNEAPKETTKTYSWDLTLSTNVEAKLLPNGGVGIYSADNNLFNVQTDNQADKDLLTKARTNGQKNTLAFELPAPFILDQTNQQNYQDAKYTLENNTLTLTVTNLQKHSYPLTIDPTITVTTTADFNQLTGDTGNIDNSTDGQIQRATSTTGAVGATNPNGTGFTTGRDNHTSVVYNGFMYIAGGFDGTNYLNDIQYCPLDSNGSVGACTQQTNAFTTARSEHTSVVYNGYLYIIGGYNNSYQNDIQYCPLNSNGSVGTCTQQTNAFTTARSEHTSVVYNGYLYIIGGSSGSRQNDIQYCPLNSNGSVGTCTQQTNAFTTVRSSHISVVYNGYLYIAGGLDGISNRLDDIQYCPLNSNGSVGTCTQQTSALSSARYGHASVVYKGYLYIIGGNPGSLQNDVQYCPINSNGSVGTCTQQTSAFTTARYNHTSIAYNGYLYVIGGRQLSATYQSDIQYLRVGSPVSPTTQQGAAFTTARSGQASVIWAGYLYIIGGLAGGTGQNDIQYCPLNATNGSVGTCTQQTNAFTTARYEHTSVVWAGYLYIIGGYTGGYFDDIQYCPLNSNGSVGTCTQQTGAFTTARSSHASVVYNGYLYIIGGGAAAGSQNDIQYCPINSNGSVGTCTQQTSTFTTARNEHASVAYNGYLYIIGGHDGTNYLNDIQYCPINSNGSVGTCTQQTSAFTTARRQHVAVATNGYLYIIGGYSPTYLNDIQHCPLNSNGSVGTCSQKTSAFTTGRYNHSVAVHNGYLYFLGGLASGSVAQSDIIRMSVGASNGGQGSNVTNGTGFTTARYAHTSVEHNGYLYIIGGWNGTTYYNDIQRCPLSGDGSVGTCTQQTNAFTTERRNHTSAVYNNYLYIIGGISTGAVQQNDIQRCPLNGDGSVGTCTQQTSAFTTARSFHSSVIYNNYLYIIGGTSGTPQNDIQYCPLNGDGSVGTCTRQTSAFTGARYGQSSFVRGGLLYIVGGLFGTAQNDIQYCPINSDGSVSSCTRQTNAFPAIRYAHTSVVYNGYLYIVGGNNGSAQNDIQYCQIATTGPLENCVTQSSAFTTARDQHSSIVYNGNVFIVGGVAGGTSQSDIQYLPLKTIADTARYERFFDTGSAANNMTSVTLQGSTVCLYTLTYKTAGSNGVWGSATTLRNVVPGVAQSVSGTAQRYLFATATLDDSTCGGTSTITSMSLIYNAAPDAPTLLLPAASAVNVNTLPEFRLGTTDDSNDYLRFKIEVCSTSNCSSVVRTIDQTSSQTGWTSQNVQSGTAYAGGASITQIAIHQYQPTGLSANTQYWWRAQAIDPGGVNTWSSYSSIGTFTTAAAARSQLSIGGGTSIYGGVNLSTGN